MATFRGPAFPFVKSQGGSFQSKPALDLIWSSILLIMLTQRGTRIMFYEFGTRLVERIFDRMTNHDVASVATELQSQIETYERRVVVEDVEPRMEEKSHTLYLRITIRIRDDVIRDQRTFLISPSRSVKMLRS